MSNTPDKIPTLAQAQRTLATRLATAQHLAHNVEDAVNDAELLRTAEAIYAAQQLVKQLDAALASAHKAEAVYAGVKARESAREA